MLPEIFMSLFLSYQCCLACQIDGGPESTTNDKQFRGIRMSDRHDLGLHTCMLSCNLVRTCNSYMCTAVCPSVRGDNPRAFSSWIICRTGGQTIE